jgi:NifU-like protein
MPATSSGLDTTGAAAAATPNDSWPRTRGIGRAGSRACGGGLRLVLEVDPATSTVQEIEVQAFCRGVSGACYERLHDALEGRALDAVLALSQRDLADILGDDDDQRLHQAVMAHEALWCAACDLRGVPLPPRPSMACQCYALREDTLVRTIRMNRLTRLSDVTTFTNAGKSCGTCAECVSELLARVNAEMVQEGVLRPDEAHTVARRRRDGPRETPATLGRQSPPDGS